MSVVSTRAAYQQEVFFKFAFTEEEGYICISQRNISDKKFKDNFFNWPEDVAKIVEFIENNALTHDMWYCPQILARPVRQKEAVKCCPTLWSDLDTCQPERARIVPSVVVQSSPGRFQALWRLSAPVAPEVGEDYSRRIAYAHADDGADKSGWDLTQLLRVPFTPNHKYDSMPEVKIVTAKVKTYDLKEFDVYEPLSGSVDTPYPFPLDVPEMEDVIALHRDDINPICYTMIAQQPKQGDDWSSILWKLEVLLFESGLSREEVYAVAKGSACNKYARDNRSESMLWRDVCRAYNYKVESIVEEQPSVHVDYHSDLLTAEDRRAVEANPTIIEDYIAYGAQATDAAVQYHQAGIFVILSSCLAGSVVLPTKHGLMPLNLWFMILADTTLTRKSTALDLASNILDEVMPDALLATDGSIEGLFQALSTRSGSASVFRRDEVAGLLEAMAKRDYYAGMAEALAGLYDGTTQKRVLRKETFLVHKPRLILYTAGIRSKVSDTLTQSQVESGFLPRFVIITADAHVANMRPEGPPTIEGTQLRASLCKRVEAIKAHYGVSHRVTSGSKTTLTPRTWEASLTTDAWALYNKFSGILIKDADESPHRSILIPTYERLARSALKSACLIAAATRFESKVVVTEEDLIRAFYYAEGWRKYAYGVVLNLEKTPFEKTAERALMMIVKEPGITRGRVMTVLKLTSRQADDMLTTLKQRGMVKITGGKGGSEKLYPVWEPS